MESQRVEPAGRAEMVRSLFVLLIVAGVGLGVLLSMEVRGRERRARLAAQNHDLQTRLAFVEAKHGEVLTVLGRPQTVIVKLTGTGEWTGQALNVAWNPVQRVALLLIDRLPAPLAGQSYQFRAVAPDGAAVPIGELDVEGPSRRLYNVPPSVGDPVRFDVTLGGGGADGSDRRVVFQMVKA